MPAYFTGGMEVLRAAALIAATMTMGLVAGVFALYANTIMPGLRRTGIASACHRLHFPALPGCRTRSILEHVGGRASSSGAQHDRNPDRHRPNQGDGERVGDGDGGSTEGD